MAILRVTRLAVLAWSLFWAGAAAADSLSGSDIENFIDSLVELNSMEDEFADLELDMERQADENEVNMPDFEHLISGSISKIEDHPSFDKFRDVIEDNGFDSPDEWGETGDRIFRAWMAIEMESQSATVNADIAEALKEIDSNPHMTQAQKDQMKAMMSGAMSAMEQASNAPAEDIEALRPHLGRLREVTEAEMQ